MTFHISKCGGIPLLYCEQKRTMKTPYFFSDAAATCPECIQKYRAARKGYRGVLPIKTIYRGLQIVDHGDGCHYYIAYKDGVPTYDGETLREIKKVISVHEVIR